MKFSSLCLILAASLSAGAAHATFAPANLIDTTYGIGAGSFELGVFTPRGTGSDNFQSLSGSATTMIGWTVGGVGVDWLHTPNYGASDGVHAVDLGWYIGGAGSVSINLHTVQGATYALSFEAAAVWPTYSTYTNTGTVTVSAGSLTANFAPAFSAENAFASQVFYTQNYQFIANSSNTVLTIAAATAGTSYGPVIDDVKVSLVSAPVPEPETYALMLAGLGLVGFAARRRSTSAN